MTRSPLLGCIEAGGTKFVLGVARDINTMLQTATIPTTDPQETIGTAIEFFAAAQAEWGPFDAFGIASFGPVDLDRASPHWGHIGETPKAGWSGIDLVGPFAQAFGCRVGFDTDVNGAILAETMWGAAVGTDVAIYVTVGTGIGGGAMVEDRPVHGSCHPEMGHMLPRRHPDDRDFAGVCPFHGDCLEGLASGPAIAARWGASLSELAADHPAHEIIADYLAQLVIAQQAILSPRRIILGGGVLGTPGLLERVRQRAARLANGYFGADDYATLIVRPGLNGRSGLLGAMALAQRARR
ncbi:ROK family protein [Sphingomonas sp. 37zxx]|uniref:ROK family protein n=1 Tax=Sphingomonas sp. 37zxx TaxID=1550073 RepID=UPI00053BE77B|nr:ROK family protein [Sphingomonas sp. 37zxx]